MTELRWILLLIGIAAFAGIYLHGLWQARSGRPLQRREPKLRTDTPSPPDSGTEMPRQGESKTAPGPIPKVDKLVTLYIEAGADKHFSGKRIFAYAQRLGLEFADDGLFHRVSESESRRLYSMANMVNPGIFDRDEKHLLKTSGLTFFMGLPGPLTAVEGFDAMLAAAQRVAELLEAEVCDEQHCPLSRQRILHLRDEMRSYDRRKRSTPSFLPR